MRKPTTEELQYVSRLAAAGDAEATTWQEMMLRVQIVSGVPRDAALRSDGIWILNGNVIGVPTKPAEYDALEKQGRLRDLARVEAQRAMFDLKRTCGVPLDARWDQRANNWVDAVTGEPLEMPDPGPAS